MHRIRVSFCIALLSLLQSSGALARPAAAPVVVAEPGDPRVLRALEAMAAARRHGAARPMVPPPTEAPMARMARERIEDPTGGGEGTPASATAFGWAPYSGTWDLDDAAHLMRRSVVGARFEEMTWARDQGLAAALAALLAPQPPPAPPGPWVDEPPPEWWLLTPAEVDSVVDAYLERQRTIILWWVERFVYEQTGLTETMTLFWHDHFATAAETVFFPQAIWGQLALLRGHALGNFRTLTRELCTDPAMLIWLNGDGNTVDDPNENFARELLELFTMGEGSGYTQTDVEEAARACTGYVTDGVTTFFVPAWHDDGQKTILGQTGNWGMDELVDIVFEQPATAEYLCGKLYRWFVDDEPSAEDVAALAATLRAGDYEIAPVLEQMLGSDHFQRPTFRGALVKDPLDLYAGQVRALHAVDFNPLTTTGEYEVYWVSWQMWDLGMMLTNPPNVAGWPGHRNWINTATLPLRKEYSTMIVDGTMWGTPLGFQVDALAEAGRLTAPDDAYALVDDLALLLFGAPPTPLVEDLLLDALLQGSPAYAWSTANPEAEDRIRDLLRYMMRLPDYQLK